MIDIAIVDDHKIVVDGLEHIINASGIAYVIDREFSLSGCYEMLKRCKPDILIIDDYLSDGSSIEFIPQIIIEFSSIKIIMLASYADYTIVSRAFDIGVSGFIHKSSVSDVIIKGISEVSSGNRFLCQQTVELSEQTKSNVAISPREREVLKLIVEGYSMKQIADKLSLRFETVRSYCKRLHMKLHVNNTASLVRKAIELKII